MSSSKVLSQQHIQLSSTERRISMIRHSLGASLEPSSAAAFDSNDIFECERDKRRHSSFHVVFFSSLKCCSLNKFLLQDESIFPDLEAVPPCVCSKISKLFVSIDKRRQCSVPFLFFHPTLANIYQCQRKILWTIKSA